MEENWDDEITTNKPILPTGLAENKPEETKFGFATSFAKKDTDENKENSVSSFSKSFGFKSNSEINNNEEVPNLNNKSFERKEFAGRGRRITNFDNKNKNSGYNYNNSTNNSEEKRDGFSRNSFQNRNQDESENTEKRNFSNLSNQNEGKSEGFYRFNRDKSQPEEERKSSFSFANKNKNENEDKKESNFTRREGFNNRNREDNGENRDSFSKFNRHKSQDNGERQRFNRDGDEQRRFNRDGDQQRKFNRDGDDQRRYNRDGDQQRRFNRDADDQRRFNNRNNNENGEKKDGFFRGNFSNRNRDENENGEKRDGFSKSSFSNRNREEGESGSFSKREEQFRDKSLGSGERKSFNRRENDREGNFNKFSNRNRDENENFERRGYKNKENDENNGERKTFGKRENGDFEKKFEKDEKDSEKREKYIPNEVEDTEENLFTTIATGINFEKQINIPAHLTGKDCEKIKPITKFEDASFTELLMNNIKKSKYQIPTPVQKYSIPTILAKRDLMACAQTGSGKTAAYLLPIMTNILNDGLESSALMSVQEPQALILSPTRELALQIFSEAKKFSYESMIKTRTLYGGVDTGYQLRKLSEGCNILVATPGRLLDMIEKGKISLKKVKYFVLDEADRMLDLGFEPAVRDILKKGQVNEKTDRCTFMFSATFPSEIQQLAQDFLNDYLFLTVGSVGGANTDVEQTFCKVSKFEKRDKCLEFINDIGNEKIMIFTEHKKYADLLAFFLIQKGYSTTSIHGDRKQSQREIALQSFKSGKDKILVCTSVAARGLDIEKVSHVINYDLPHTVDEYVHRIGRTGRCGNVGKAISFFDPESENDMNLARPLVRILTQASQEVPDWLNSFAEGTVGSSFVNKACTKDLRKNFSAPEQPAPKLQEEEEVWD